MVSHSLWPHLDTHSAASTMEVNALHSTVDSVLATDFSSYPVRWCEFVEVSIAASWQPSTRATGHFGNAAVRPPDIAVSPPFAAAAVFDDFGMTSETIIKKSSLVSNSLIVCYV